MQTMRVIVDTDLCEAHGACVRAAPNFFHLADDDTLKLAAHDVPAGELPAVRRAVQACPRQALRLDAVDAADAVDAVDAADKP